MSENKRRKFDFKRSKQRHIALKLLYFGWDYGGLAQQSLDDNTVEGHLFKALRKTCLIESRESCNYNRCGRTDKGVSSCGQVVNLDIRSNLIDENDPQNVGLFTPDGYIGDDSVSTGKQLCEINYVDTLNRVLPDHIRVLAWAPVNKEFSSRFDCQSRSYSYIFPRGDLCIGSMREALSHFIGHHDFRNLCSLDLKNGVLDHHRTIFKASIEPIRSIDVKVDQDANPYTFYEIHIVGKAFLYHQIRCIMTVLFLVGTKKESPEVVRDLLDIKKCKSKPNYNCASSLPLNLFECEYASDKFPLGWKYDRKSILNVHNNLKQIWLGYKTKAMMIESVISNLETSLLVDGTGSPVAGLDTWKDFGLGFDTMCDAKYTPLMSRPRDETLETKIEKMQAKQRSVDNFDKTIQVEDSTASK